MIFRCVHFFPFEQARMMTKEITPLDYHKVQFLPQNYIFWSKILQVCINFWELVLNGEESEVGGGCCYCWFTCSGNWLGSTTVEFFSNVYLLALTIALLEQSLYGIFC